MQYEFQKLNTSTGWKTIINNFRDIDPNDAISDEIKELYIYGQEDLLYITKDNYHVDLGWYGYDNLNAEDTGFWIYLFRGKDWHNCELLEKYHSRNKNEITAKIEAFMFDIDNGQYDNLTGYFVSETDSKNFNDIDSLGFYSAKSPNN